MFTARTLLGTRYEFTKTNMVFKMYKLNRETQEKFKKWWKYITVPIAHVFSVGSTRRRSVAKPSCKNFATANVIGKMLVVRKCSKLKHALNNIKTLCRPCRTYLERIPGAIRQ